eukprot:TRINITY_DN26631_c0_g1_i1.p2 TRINITY_DN26631_c0_g1~~TRINITY_DN26631_c0_g1_i1.p2  ORF type:complete len:121 (-),score=45.83 TRINITY_DN26631_c0_g1_i1:140-502(-)
MQLKAASQMKAAQPSTYIAGGKAIQPPPDDVNIYEEDDETGGLVVMEDTEEGEVINANEAVRDLMITEILAAADEKMMGVQGVKKKHHQSPSAALDAAAKAAGKEEKEEKYRVEGNGRGV